MDIGRKLRELRLAENLSQGEIEKRTGLLRAYTSRVENGHSTPSIATLEKYARALEIPLYALFYEGSRSAQFDLKLKKMKQLSEASISRTHEFESLVRAAAHLDDGQRAFLMHLANQLVQRGTKARRRADT